MSRRDLVSRVDVVVQLLLLLLLLTQKTFVAVMNALSSSPLARDARLCPLDAAAATLRLRFPALQTHNHAISRRWCASCRLRHHCNFRWKSPASRFSR